MLPRPVVIPIGPNSRRCTLERTTLVGPPPFPSPVPPERQAKKRFLIGNAPPTDLASLSLQLNVVRVLGNPAKPDALVAMLDQNELSALRHRFPHLIIEEDSELNLA